MSYYSILITHCWRKTLLVTAILVTATSLACDSEPHKTDAELGLTPQQAHGRRVFEQRCQECHFAYIPRNLHGPSLQGLYKKQAMTSGIPVNDERVRELIVLGRSKMPAFGRVLTEQQVDDLLRYLHTL